MSRGVSDSELDAWNYDCKWVKQQWCGVRHFACAVLIQHTGACIWSSVFSQSLMANQQPSYHRSSIIGNIILAFWLRLHPSKIWNPSTFPLAGAVWNLCSWRDSEWAELDRIKTLNLSDWSKFGIVPCDSSTSALNKLVYCNAETRNIQITAWCSSVLLTDTMICPQTTDAFSSWQQNKTVFTIAWRLCFIFYHQNALGTCHWTSSYFTTAV